MDHLSLSVKNKNSANLMRRSNPNMAKSLDNLSAYHKRLHDERYGNEYAQGEVESYRDSSSGVPEDSDL